MAVAGAFYPEREDQLRSMVADFLGHAAHKAEGNVQVVIVPHAGYVFSGQTAADAYAMIPETADYKHIFVLGPSHRAYIAGALADDRCEAYRTPLGNVAVDHEVCRKLRESCDIFLKEGDIPGGSEEEHCIEVQLPFLQERLRSLRGGGTPAGPKLVPIIIGTERLGALRKLAAALQPYFTEENLFVVSSDFSHYPGYEGAEKADRRTAEAILTRSLEKFIKALSDNEKAGIRGLETSACGACAIATLLMLMDGDGRHFDIRHVSYSNSGDSPYGGKDQVVGYNSFVIMAESKQDNFTLTDEEKATLLGLARRSIESSFEGKPLGDSWKGITLTPSLQALCGAFVTLNEDGQLRGCIGLFGESDPLYQVVAEMARAAAFEDPRFAEVRKSELPAIKIEISVLTPLRRISSADEFRYGKEGIYMVRNGRSGTFLPQVADEVCWTKEEFLGHCARDKAGIGWDGWRDADLYTYEAIVFSEK